MQTYDLPTEHISFSLLGLCLESIVELMECVKNASYGHEDTRPFEWFFDVCLDEIELSQTPELERGLIRPPCEDWTALELSNFYRAFHVLSYEPLSAEIAKVVDGVVTLALGHMLYRLLGSEKCYSH